MYYIFTVGLSLSGKTWLVKKIKERFPRQFEVIETRAIHDYLNTMDLWKDDNTVEGKSYELRQKATKAIRKSLIEVFGREGISLIQDSSNLIAKDRAERLAVVKDANPNIKSVLIFVNTDKQIVEGRAKKDDALLKKDGYKEAWYDLYLKQIERFEVPNKEEADYFIEYDGKNWESVLKKLEEIMRP